MIHVNKSIPSINVFYQNQNHNILWDNGGHLLMITRQMPTKAGKVSWHLWYDFWRHGILWHDIQSFQGKSFWSWRQTERCKLFNFCIFYPRCLTVSVLAIERSHIFLIRRYKLDIDLHSLLAFVVIWRILKHYEMKHEMTQWKCFVQTHLLFVTIYGLMSSSSVTFKHKMTLAHSNVLLVTQHHYI